ncbi:hypothetical protein [Thermococcus barophilus]|nr:hypothetical protein [Thermococcus barophilus]
MVAVGIWVLLFFPYKFASFGWLLFGVFQLASYMFSNAEKNKALLLVLSITVLSIICAYILGLKVALFSLALIGAVLSGTVWWRESLGTKYLILITKDGNYLLTYSNENDIKSLLVALGGKGGEA